MNFNIFQWLVDTSQKQPHWWARQATIISMILLALRVALRGAPDAGTYVLVAVCLVAFCLNWYMTADAERCAYIGTSPVWFSRLFWVFVIFAALLSLAEQTASGYAGAAWAICFNAIYSFAACRPPAPPKRKYGFSRVPEGGGA